MAFSPGSTRITADGVVGTSGAATRIYGLIVRSDGDGASVVNLRAGTAVSGTIWDVINVGAADTTVRVEYEGGLLFPDGAYIDVDGNTSFVTVIYQRAQ